MAKKQSVEPSRYEYQVVYESISGLNVIIVGGPLPMGDAMTIAGQFNVVAPTEFDQRSYGRFKAIPYFSGLHV